MVWKIGTNPLGNGYQVYRWNGSGWDGSDGGAYRIAVDPNGVPWVRDLSGNIYRKGDNNPFISGTWQVLPGQARDIGIGANEAVWRVGLNALGDGWQVSRWNGSDWDPSDGGAASVSVTPSGIPWVLTNTSLNFTDTPAPIRSVEPGSCSLASPSMTGSVRLPRVVGQMGTCGPSDRPVRER